MSWEAWGTPDDPDPVFCELCEDPIGSSSDCALCTEYNRADEAENELAKLRRALAHRVRALQSTLPDGAAKLWLTIMRHDLGIEVDQDTLTRARDSCLTFKNAYHMFAPKVYQDSDKRELALNPKNEATALECVGQFDEARVRAKADQLLVDCWGEQVTAKALTEMHQLLEQALHALEALKHD